MQYIIWCATQSSNPVIWAEMSLPKFLLNLLWSSAWSLTWTSLTIKCPSCQMKSRTLDLCRDWISHITLISPFQTLSSEYQICSSSTPATIISSVSWTIFTFNPMFPLLNITRNFMMFYFIIWLTSKRLKLWLVFILIEYLVANTFACFLIALISFLTWYPKLGLLRFDFPVVRASDKTILLLFYEIINYCRCWSWTIGGSTSAGISGSLQQPPNTKSAWSTGVNFLCTYYNFSTRNGGLGRSHHLVTFRISVMW